MRLAYLGTPEIAVPPLRALVDEGHTVALVVTNRDKRRGRGGALVPSPVKAAAGELGLRVTDRVDDVLDLDPPAELGVVVAFGRLIKPHVLAAVPMINLHFSLLPRWRGAAPVERAILAGDDRIGVCVMEVAEALDAGDVYACEAVPVGQDETADEIRERLVAVGTSLLVGLLGDGLPRPVAQEGDATYAHKIDPAELEIDWTRPTQEVHRLVRIGDAWTTHHGKRLKVWRSTLSVDTDGIEVPAGDGVLHVLEVQPEGKPRMPATAWARGARWGQGDRLGT
ncbi:MAG: methionyl-tRNA formyltransferase [Acidimicrobiales bacterium]